MEITQMKLALLSAPLRVPFRTALREVNMPNTSLTAVIMATNGGSTTLASSTIFSPRGTSACCSFLVLASISCMGV